MSPPFTSTPNGLNIAKKGPDTVLCLCHPSTQNLDSKRSSYSNVNAQRQLVRAELHVLCLPSATPASLASRSFSAPGLLLPQGLSICDTLHLWGSPPAQPRSFPQALASSRCLLKCTGLSLSTCQYFPPRHFFAFLSLALSIIKITHQNGTPLQYSCLENPMDRGAW